MSDDPHKEFPGNRPSLSLLFDELDAFSCGQILALFEHRYFINFLFFKFCLNLIIIELSRWVFYGILIALISLVLN